MLTFKEIIEMLTEAHEDRQLRRATQNLESIVVRCEEGDPRSNWLPVIADLAREALTLLATSTARLRAENERLRNACASGWGEPTLINMLRAEKEQLLAENEQLRTALLGIADMPEHDQDDAHRLRDKARRALGRTWTRREKRLSL